MFRYYQLSNDSKWLPVPDSDQVKSTVLEAGAKKLTILSVSEIVSDDTDREKLSFKGPLYFDIDSADVVGAAASCASLIGKLKDLEVPDDAIDIFASGGKGFHVIVPATVFSTGRALKGLPSVYKEMALSLYVPGMDFGVYCGGRGN